MVQIQGLAKSHFSPYILLTERFTLCYLFSTRSHDCKEIAGCVIHRCLAKYLRAILAGNIKVTERASPVHSINPITAQPLCKKPIASMVIQGKNYSIGFADEKAQLPHHHIIGHG